MLGEDGALAFGDVAAGDVFFGVRFHGSLGPLDGVLALGRAAREETEPELADVRQTTTTTNSHPTGSVRIGCVALGRVRAGMGNGVQVTRHGRRRQEHSVQHLALAPSHLTEDRRVVRIDLPHLLAGLLL